MRQLPRILLLLVATVIVIVALLVSGLRLAMPHLDSYRSNILQIASNASGMPIKASKLQGKWENFGPTLEIHDLNVEMKDSDKLTIARVNLALDVWQSLLHWRWQFRDLTFWQLHLDSNRPLLASDEQKNSFKPAQINELFLRQFDHFDLRDSSIRFLTPSGQHAELAIPKLTWVNEKRVTAPKVKSVFPVLPANMAWCRCASISTIAKVYLTTGASGCRRTT